MSEQNAAMLMLQGLQRGIGMLREGFSVLNWKCLREKIYAGPRIRKTRFYCTWVLCQIWEGAGEINHMCKRGLIYIRRANLRQI